MEQKMQKPTKIWLQICTQIHKQYNIKKLHLQESRWSEL